MTTTIIHGDIAEGQQWWGVAEHLKRQLAHIYKSNNAFMHSWKQVSSDTKIFCEMRNGVPWATIFADSGLYMESGFYNLRSSATCAEDTFKPAVLHYNPPVQDYLSSVAKPYQGILDIGHLEGQDILDGTTSKSVPFKKLTTSVVDLCGNNYVSETADYASSSESILKQKQTQNRIPSSLFSGKMRLFVQAIYGSKRDDYYTPLGDNNLPIGYDLYIGDAQGNDFLLNWGYPGTHGVLTTTDYKHYLISVGSSLTVYPLVISSAAERLRQKLAASTTLTAEQINKLEGYLLSAAKPDVAHKSVVEISNSSALDGYPMAYGFKFSESGQKARVVLQKDISVAQDKKNLQATDVEITISEINGQFSAAATVKKQGTWSHNSYFVAWVPDFYIYSQLQYGEFDTGTNQTRDFPFYGWYDGETYNPLNVSIDVQHSTSVRDDSFEKQVETVCEQALSVAYQYTQNGANGSIITSGLYDKTLTCEHMSSYRTKTWYWSITAWGTTGVATSSAYDGNPLLCSLGTTAMQYLTDQDKWTHTSYYNIKWEVPFEGANYSLGTSFISRVGYLRNNFHLETGRAISSKIGLIIPLLDSESLVYTDKITTWKDSQNTWVGAIDHSCSVPYWEVKFVKVRNEFGTTGNLVIIEDFNVEPTLHTPSYSEYSAGASQGWQYDIDEASAYIGIVNPVSKWFSSAEDGWDIKTTSGTPANSAWVDGYVWAPFHLPLSGDTVITQSSYNGATITYHGEGTGENVNGYRNHNAVGWA